MIENQLNKRKILNDPVYGFITIPFEIIFDIIEHPWFQRLRRIQQLGLSNLVYPGAMHTRFNHALGATWLMGRAIYVLRSKGHQISDEEAEAATIAILLHDIGHGPFSHALENTLIKAVNHENLSLLIMQKLNEEYGGRLSLALQIFEGKYHKKFLNQLVSGQLDVDRMDYLIRDSYFTGVHEGVIGYDRLIEMMDVVNDELVIEEKGVYSVEKFIVARRVMYWQVYLHKTVICAEQMLIKILQRAEQLAREGKQLSASPALHKFLYTNVDEIMFSRNNEFMNAYTSLDDSDIYVALKQWQKDDDKVLAYLCNCVINRKLFRIELENQPPSTEKISLMREKVMEKYNLSNSEAEYFIFQDSTSNSAYSAETKNINIKLRSGEIVDVAKVSNHLNLTSLAGTVVKHYLCYPKYL